ncbi:MAG: hypothetical protein E7110_05580 [Bacteroidales bacterium]|nr:hypothetical protein [Bacteroidales bacterium]MBE6246853.1 hypothetical protein [Bacteroidales bacterium]
MTSKIVTFNADSIAEREVVYFRYELKQKTDIEGQPIGSIRGGYIYLKVKSKDNGEEDLMEWMCNTYLSKNGFISIANDQGSEIKKVCFKEAYMIEYAETYDKKDELQQYEEFTITCKEIQVGSAHYDNGWTIV